MPLTSMNRIFTVLWRDQYGNPHQQHYSHEDNAKQRLRAERKNGYSATLALKKRCTVSDKYLDIRNRLR